MTRKSRLFSAIAIAAAGALMITTTAYQSKAADPTGVAAAWADYETDDDFNAISNLNTTSTGTFRYDAPGTDEDIEIASGDIKSLESAVKGLARQVTSLGNKAKAADTALETDVTTAVASAKDAITSDIANIETAIGSLNTTITNDDATIKSDLSTLKTNVNSIKSTVNSLNTAITSSASSSTSTGTIRTDAGVANLDYVLHTSGTYLSYIYSRGGMGDVFVIWSGIYSTDELARGTSTDGTDLKHFVTAQGVWQQEENQVKGFLGQLAYVTNSNGYVNLFYFGEDGTIRSITYPSNCNSNYIASSDFTLARVVS